MRDEADDLLLSQLTHAGYCLRRAALIMNEQLWQESGDTAKGRMEHERTHTRRMAVFEVLVDPAQLAVLKAGLAQTIDPERDSVRFYRLGKSYQHRIETMGRKPMVEAGGELMF